MAQARRSALAGRNAGTSPTVQPQASPQESSAEDLADYTPPDTGGRVEAAAGAASEAAGKGKKKKIGFYQTPEEAARTRAAWAHTMGHTGHTTITSYMEAAIASYTRQLEAEYNDSKPFS